MAEIEFRRHREEPRIKLPLPINVEWETEEGSLILEKAWSANVSYQGLCLTLDKRAAAVFSNLKIGSRINLATNHYHLSAAGTVRYIVNQPDGKMTVGLRLESPLFGSLSRYNTCSQNLLTNFL